MHNYLCIMDRWLCTMVSIMNEVHIFLKNGSPAGKTQFERVHLRSHKKDNASTWNFKTVKGLELASHYKKADRIDTIKIVVSITMDNIEQSDTIVYPP